MKKNVSYKKILFLPWYFALFQIVLGVHIVHPYLHSHGHEEVHAVHSHHDYEDHHSDLFDASNPNSDNQHSCVICKLLAANPVFTNWSDEFPIKRGILQQEYHPSEIENSFNVSSAIFIRGPPQILFA